MTEENIEISKERIIVPPPNFKTVEFKIVGTSPLVINKFSQKSRKAIIESMKKGSLAQKKNAKNKPAKDFDEEFEQARHKSEEGWDGIHAGSFRNAMVRACKLVGLEMTLAKLVIFIEPDGFDADEGTPLVKILGGEPSKHIAYVRPNGTINICARPMWKKWNMNLRVKFDNSLFYVEDIANLLVRVGQQCGIGEGRHSSPKSCGVGWGCFKLEER